MQLVNLLQCHTVNHVHFTFFPPLYMYISFLLFFLADVVSEINEIRDNVIAEYSFVVDTGNTVRNSLSITISILSLFVLDEHQKACIRI